MRRRIVAVAAVILSLAVTLTTVVAQLPTAAPNSPYQPGFNSIAVMGGGSAADVTRVIERDSRLRVLALWMLFGGTWRYFLPPNPSIDGGLTLFPQTGSAVVLLDFAPFPPPPPPPFPSPSPTPTPTPSVTPTPPPPISLRITRVDNGRTFTLAVGQRFELDLSGDGLVWQVTVANPNIVTGDPMILIFPPPSRTTWTARAVGETTLSAVGDAPCRFATPPCQTFAPSLLFEVRLIVR